MHLQCECLEGRLLLAAQPAAMTVLVYMNGDNDLSSYVNADLNEMEAVNYGDSVRVAVLADYRGGNNTERGLIQHDSNSSSVSSPLVNIGEKDMGNPSTLTDFINWGVKTYPAQRYGLVLWDHGNGFTGFGNPEELEMSELRRGIADSGVKFDFVGFDACFMQMGEVAYQMRGLANVMLASETSEPESGWLYTPMLHALNNNPDLSAAGIGKAEVNAYGSARGVQSTYMTLSTVDLNRVDELASSLDQFAAKALSTGRSADWNALRAARNESFAAGPSAPSDSFRDLGGFMDAVASGSANADIRAAAGQVKTALRSTVLNSWHASLARAQGISVYLPKFGASLDADYNSPNLDFVNDTHWRMFLLTLTGKLNPSPVSNPAPSPTEPPRAVPGMIQTEKFMPGGEGVGYHDLTSANMGGSLRAGEGVDIGPISGGGYAVGWTQAGEWLKYSITVKNAGTYSLRARVSSPTLGGRFHLSVDGKSARGIRVPNTGGWNNWRTISAGSLYLSAGTHTLRLSMDSAGASGFVGNFDRLALTAQRSGSRSSAVQQIPTAGRAVADAQEATPCRIHGGHLADWLEYGTQGSIAGLFNDATRIGFNSDSLRAGLLAQ